MSLLVALVIKRLIKLDQNVTKNSPVVCDGRVEYEEAEVHRSAAIKQDFRKNEENKF